MNEKIAAALKSIEGATPGPWGFFDRGGKPHKLKRDGGEGMSLAYVERGMSHTDESWEATRVQIALSPALGAALRLAASVEDWRSGGSTPHTLVLMYVALDDFLAALPEVEK